jgi:hypothetical protein
VETINITFEIDRTKDLYQKYVKFERKKEFKKVPLKLLIGLFFTMVVIGVFTEVDILWILGLISSILTIGFIFYFFIKFQIAFNKFSSQLEKKVLTNDTNFQFSFNSEMIAYKSENINSEIKWTMIKGYVINDQDIYLYLANRELLDIISESLLGKEMFEKFKLLLTEKINHVSS